MIFWQARNEKFSSGSEAYDEDWKLLLLSFVVCVGEMRRCYGLNAEVRCYARFLD